MNAAAAAQRFPVEIVRRVRAAGGDTPEYTVADDFTLGGFDDLPRHIRRCVYWEVAPDGETLTDTEFDKEAWLSMLMLEWGSCGQVAIDHAVDGSTRVVGVAFYAPPRSPYTDLLCRALPAPTVTRPRAAPAPKWTTAPASPPANTNWTSWPDWKTSPRPN